MIVGYLTSSDVNSAETFATYCQQTLGTPYPRGSGIAILRRQCKLFFEQNPSADWQTLCRVADWAKSKKRRPAHAHLLADYLYRYAWQDGHLPELDPGDRRDDDVEAAIQDALEQEKDPQWRYRFVVAEGRDARKAVLDSWRNAKGKAS